MGAVLLDSAADVNVTAQDGSTPLHTALDRGHSQVVELLLSKGAYTDARVSRGRAPLHAAAERGNLEAVDALLAHEADPNARWSCCGSHRGTWHPYQTPCTC